MGIVVYFLFVKFFDLVDLKGKCMFIILRDMKCFFDGEIFLCEFYVCL